MLSMKKKQNYNLLLTMLVILMLKKKLTIPDLKKKKNNKERLVMVAVGEYLSAKWAEKAGVDIIGVGDSLGMTLYGHENTIKMTVEQMINHCQAVKNGAPNTFCILAMPYGSYATKKIAVKNAIRMMKESGADAVKMQGGKEMFEIIKAIADSGVPVMSHVGLTPHFVHGFGGFKMQGKTAQDAIDIIENAKAIEKAGAIGIEIEAVPDEVAKAVDDSTSIFTFSIGAGSSGNCQLLNGYDLIGSFDSFKPKFAKRYGNVGDIAVAAFKNYADEVRKRKFPDNDHSYQMPSEEVSKLSSYLK